MTLTHTFHIIQIHLQFLSFSPKFPNVVVVKNRLGACSTALPTLAGALAATGLPCNSEQQTGSPASASASSAFGLRLRPLSLSLGRALCCVGGSRRRRSRCGHHPPSTFAVPPLGNLAAFLLLLHFLFTLSVGTGGSFYAIIILSTFPDPNRCAPGFPLSHPTPVPHPKRSPISRDHVPRRFLSRRWRFGKITLSSLFVEQSRFTLNI